LRKQSNAASIGQTLRERGVNSAVIATADLIKEMFQNGAEYGQPILGSAR
jgi:phospholipase/lecithinase/hemolysin